MCGENTEKSGSIMFALCVVLSLWYKGTPEEAKKGVHGTSEYFMIRNFIGSIKSDTNHLSMFFCATEWTIPGIIAHESAMKCGKWLEGPILK